MRFWLPVILIVGGFGLMFGAIHDRLNRNPVLRDCLRPVPEGQSLQPCRGYYRPLSD
jgi:hypothetical protein